jgi:hypothetical protein
MEFEIRLRNGRSDVVGGPYKGFAHSFKAFDPKDGLWKDPKEIFPRVE